jgi:hypothetical protein
VVLNDLTLGLVIFNFDVKLIKWRGLNIILLRLKYYILEICDSMFGHLLRNLLHPIILRGFTVENFVILRQFFYFKILWHQFVNICLIFGRRLNVKCLITLSSWICLEWPHPRSSLQERFRAQLLANLLPLNKFMVFILKVG